MPGDVSLPWPAKLADGAVSVPGIVRAHARTDTGAVFLRLILPGQDDCILSYAQLVVQADRWAAFYQRAGIGVGARIIVSLPHSSALYAAYLGALLGGQIPAMVAFPSPKLSEKEYFRTIGALLRVNRASLVVTYPELAAKLNDRETAALGGAVVVTPQSVPEGPAPAATASPATDEVAFLQYSSGTTGAKKGVAVTHRALLTQIDLYSRQIGLTGSDRIASWLPLYHDMGLITCFFLPILMKIPLVAMSPFDWVRRPAMWLKAVSEQRCTLSWLPNFAYNFMAQRVAERDLEGLSLAGLRGVVNCSEPVLAASHEAFLARFMPLGMTRGQLAASYAMAENTFAVTSGGFGVSLLSERIDAASLERDGVAAPAANGAEGRVLVSSGRILPEHEVRIVSPEGSDLPDRRVGEIVIRSNCLMENYEGNQEETAERLRDGWFFTGDIGYRVGADLFVTGRKRDLIIIGGRNFYPQDIEAVLERIDGVIPGRIVALGIPDARVGTERLVILAESAVEDDANRHRIVDAIRTAVAEAVEAVADEIRLVPPRWLAKSSSGKISRNENRRRYLETLVPIETAPVPARDDGQRARVRRCVAQVAGHRSGAAALADDTPLFEGGFLDSFDMAELLVTLEAAFGIAIPPETLSRPGALGSIAAIADMLVRLEQDPQFLVPQWTWLEPAAIPMTWDEKSSCRPSKGIWSLLYGLLFRWKGIRVGPGLSVLGPLLLQIDGKAANISLGRNVTLMPGVHLKNRENGRIVLHDDVKLDTQVRLVAANDAVIELGAGVTLGAGTLINAGRDVRFGRGCMTSAYCMINASDHGMSAGRPIRTQPYEHAPIYFGEDVFVGAHAYIGKGSRIGNGALVSAGAAVTGAVPALAVVNGRPARIVGVRR